MWQSCCGERASSHINRPTTRERPPPGDETSSDLVFSTFNIPHIHEADLKIFLANCEKYGRVMGVSESGLRSRAVGAKDFDSNN